MPISYPISKFVVADTAVFWDVVYCPIPSGLVLDKIYQNIKSALKNEGYYGKLSIFTYGDENQNVEDIESTGIKCVFTGDEQSRVNKILDDLVNWAIGQGYQQRRANVMVIKGSILEDELYAESLCFLRSLNSNVLLAQPENLPQRPADEDEVSGLLLRRVSEVWLWESLAAGEKPIYRVLHKPKLTKGHKSQTHNDGSS